MWISLAAFAARWFGPLIVKLAPSLIPFAGWVKPAFAFLKWSLIIGVVSYATWWIVTPSDDPMAQCRSAADRASTVALQWQAEADRKAQAAAAIARASMYADLDDAAQRIADLEAELHKLSAGGDDPIAFPKSLTKELRR